MPSPKAQGAGAVPVKKKKKVRIDALVAERGLVESRTRAQAVIMAGKVMVGGAVVDKPGTPVDADSEVTLKEGLPYVGRGGVKLAGCLDDLPEKAGLAVIDLSFISLEKVLGAVRGLLSGGATVFALIKPQFEVGRGEVGKGGVVRDPEKHARVVERVKEFARTLGFEVLGVAESPITGAKGNREFWVNLRL